VQGDDDGRAERDALGRALIGLAISVHTALGPGFAEVVYRRALEIELQLAKVSYESELSIVVSYRGSPVGRHRLDLLVEKTVVLELKALPSIESVHRRQVLSYLRASRCRLGYVLNFGSPVLGVMRVIL
jgi:GxxExxY protein